MIKQEFKEKILMSLERAHAETKKDDAAVFSWDGKNSENQGGVLKIQNEVERFLNKKINTDMKQFLKCTIVEALDANSKLVARNLVLKYRPDADFDIESLVAQFQQIVENSLKSMVLVSEKSGSDPHKIKIIKSSNMAEYAGQSDQVVVVETEVEKELVSLLVTEVLARNRKAETFAITVNGENREIEFVRAANLPQESKNQKSMKGLVVYVDDSQNRVGLREYGGGTKIHKYIFGVEQRDDFIKSQLYGYYVFVEYTPSEKHKLGDLEEVGGTITSVTGLEDEKLI